MSQNQGSEELFKVLVNVEDQYAFWPIFKKEIPLGWKETGVTGTKKECGAYVREAWTDMRPLSLRKQMQEAKNTSS